MTLCEKPRQPALRYIVADTPGQIEIFTWSASGAIITEVRAALRHCRCRLAAAGWLGGWLAWPVPERMSAAAGMPACLAFAAPRAARWPRPASIALWAGTRAPTCLLCLLCLLRPWPRLQAFASTFPTMIAYVIDTPRCLGPQTFMTNMLQVGRRLGRGSGCGAERRGLAAGCAWAAGGYPQGGGGGGAAFRAERACACATALVAPDQAPAGPRHPGQSTLRPPTSPPAHASRRPAAHGPPTPPPVPPLPAGLQHLVQEPPAGAAGI